MKEALILDGAKVIGNVTFGENCSVYYNAVIRGDSNKVIIGNNTNIQDNVVLHTSSNYSLEIGDNVTIGHGAIVHGSKISNNVIIGMGAIVLDGASIGNNCIIGAGSLVSQNKIIPDNSLAYGNPIKIIRTLNEEEKKHILENTIEYVNKIDFYSKNK